MENREMWMEKVKEESTNEITLDEWKTIHKDRTKLEFNIWKSNQGADWQWKDLFFINKVWRGSCWRFYFGLSFLETSKWYNILARDQLWRPRPPRTWWQKRAEVDVDMMDVMMDDLVQQDQVKCFCIWYEWSRGISSYGLMGCPNNLSSFVDSPVQCFCMLNDTKGLRNLKKKTAWHWCHPHLKIEFYLFWKWASHLIMTES